MEKKKLVRSTETREDVIKERNRGTTPASKSGRANPQRESLKNNDRPKTKNKK